MVLKGFYIQGRYNSRLGGKGLTIVSLLIYTTELEEEVTNLRSQIKSLRLQRTDSQLRQVNEDMTNKMEVLMLENHSLKDMIREHEQVEAKLQEALQLEKEAHTQNQDRDTLEDGSTLANAIDNMTFTRNTEIEYV